jgi:hypothetical protein
MDMNQPLFPAPDGYIVDLVNPQRTGEIANFYVGLIGMILAALFLGIRIYTKVVLAKNFSADDGMSQISKTMDHNLNIYRSSSSCMGKSN